MKIALVTGAGSGLGKGFVEFLSNNGYLVYAGIHHLTDENKKIGPNIRPISLDVEDDSSISKVIESIKREQGFLDLLVNNAGVNKDSATSGRKELVTDLKSLNRELLIKMFNVNALGPLMLIKAAVPLLANRGGFIINISSNRGSIAEAARNDNGNYGYKASKAGLNMFTKSLIVDLPKNVYVAAVHPGGVHTKINPKGDLEPREAASKIYKIVENWKPEFNGAFLNNDGSLHSL